MQASGGLTNRIVNTFGAYQTYYETGILASSSPSDISWIGSVQAFLLMLVGALTGPIYDAGYFRALLAVGSFGVVFGFMMLSLAKTYWQVILAQGVCVGLGAGCLFVPSVAILSTYFSTRIATAMGIAASGSSLGKLCLRLWYCVFADIAYRRCHLSHCLLPSRTTHRLSLGNSCHRLHRSGNTHRVQLSHAHSCSTSCSSCRP